MVNYGPYQFLELAGAAEVVDDHGEPLPGGGEVESRRRRGVRHVGQDCFHCVPKQSSKFSPKKRIPWKIILTWEAFKVMSNMNFVMVAVKL